MRIINAVYSDSIPIIATPFFLERASHNYGFFSENDLVLPFYLKKKHAITYMRFVCGVIGARTLEEESIFLNNLIAYLKKNKMADMIIAPHTSAVFHAVPQGAKFCEFGSYIINLTQSEEELWAAVHSKHRNVIRKAEKDGVIISYADEYKEACRNLINETAVRQHINTISDESFDEMKKNPNVDFWVALYNDKVVGASILEWSPYSSYYIYGGSAEHTHAGAMNLLHWEAIKKMKERGVKRYDFVGARINPLPGSKQEGIQRFKSRFGGKLDKGYIWKYSFNPLKSSLYSLYMKLNGYLRHSYTKDIIDQENERVS